MTVMSAQAVAGRWAGLARRAGIALLLALTTLAAGAGGQAWAGATCAPDRVDIRGDFGAVRIRVEIADDDAERAQGLMNRPRLPHLSGMLFVFPRPQRAAFWMRNTLIPLDMLFIGPDGVIRRIHENARPLDETTIDGGTGVLAVLEVNGGLSGELGLRPGDQIRHPAFGPGAAWPCPAD